MWIGTMTVAWETVKSNPTSATFELKFIFYRLSPYFIENKNI